MAKRLGGLGLAVLGAWMAVSAASVSADEGAMSYADGAAAKLGRGLANIVTCPLELIRTPTLTGEQDGYLAGMTSGIARGIVRTVIRGGTGIFETVTFWSPSPNNFGPIFQPEFVWANGNWAE